MNIWRRGALNKNPYYRTAFRVARVSREMLQHSAVVRLLGQTRRVVDADPQAHRIRGEAVTRTDINAAEQILLDARQRIAEELLHHATELPPLQAIRKLNAEVAGCIAADTSLTPGNLEGIAPLAQALVQRYLSAVPEPASSFGALELDLAPPFGFPEEE